MAKKNDGRLEKVAAKLGAAALERLEKERTKRPRPREKSETPPLLLEAVEEFGGGWSEDEATLVAELADAVYAAAKDEREAKRARETAAKPIAQIAKEVYRLLGLDGRHSKSLDVDGVSTPGVKVTFKDVFATQKFDAHGAIVEAFAGSGFEMAACVEETRTIKIAQEFTGDDQVAKIVELIGEERFFKMFDVEVSFRLKKGADEQYHFLPEGVRALFPQSEPSIVAR